jgi:uncharacterized repeat protein (TIGR03803 family)
MLRLSFLQVRVLGVTSTLAILISTAFAASHERVLYAFKGTPDGAAPSAGLIEDTHGNFYGTTMSGGPNSDGTVFKLSRASNGAWTETILYSFSGIDGDAPVAALVMDTAGNLYGTTAGGGAYGGGTAFEVSHSSTGWTESVLHSFGNGQDGWDPQAEMVFDSAGNLYGTTQLGGAIFGRGDDNGGTVFQLTPGASGWTETILYSFTGEYLGPDPNLPAGSVVLAKNGNIYGVAQTGGANGQGAVYQLAPNSDGTYTESVIFSFNVNDGAVPNSTPVQDANGNLYGTTRQGGDGACSSVGCGVVYKLTSNGDGTRSETVLHELNGRDGSTAIGPPAFDSAGNLYAVAEAGGADSAGSIFELIPRVTGPWSESVLHTFTGGTDGAAPLAGVTIDSSGNLFGTASGGGGKSGVAFEIVHSQ